MSTAKIQIGPQVDLEAPAAHRFWIFVAVFAILLGLQVGTQRFAADFHYQPKLGSNLYHLYPPYDIVWWWLQYRTDYPRALMRAVSATMVVSSVGLLLADCGRMILANTARFNPTLHGSARWATLKDIVAAGLIAFGRHAAAKKLQGCIYVGSWINLQGAQNYLIDGSNSHVLVYAPTRSGKGVSIVVPSLLSWQPSALVLDLKDELWTLTAGWRQKHANNKVLRFDPASVSNTAAWNPLDEIRFGTDYETGDVQNLATLLVDPDGRGLETHWQKTSQALLVGVILHALYKKKDEGLPANLARIDRMLADPARPVRELWMEMATYCHRDGKNHAAVGSAAVDMMERPDEEAGSVLSTAKSYLSLYRDPVVARNTSSSDFCIRDLMHHDSPVSLYLVTPSTDQGRLRPLMRVFLNMTVRLLAGKLTFNQGRPVVNYKHRLLLMLDEFPQLGRLEVIQESLAFVATFGLKFCLICQDLNQLKREKIGYGRDESITSNCHIQVAFPPNRLETAEHLSKLTGQTTVEKAHITTSGRRASPMLGSVSRTIQEVQRALLTPDECMRMPAAQKDDENHITKAGDMLVSVAGYPAIYGRQPLYFQDPVFSQRAALDPPLKSDALRMKKPVVTAVSL